ncbi:MAG: hypothetical protein EHM13_09090 [Acidobacteria bacterium]|nr:MAG: hypothetical protein EHM13_09090 [Acidobacteriota bacterium]
MTKHLILVLALACQFGGITAITGGVCAVQAQTGHSCCSTSERQSTEQVSSDCGCRMMPASEPAGRDLPPGVGPEGTRFAFQQPLLALAPLARPPIDALLLSAPGAIPAPASACSTSFLSGGGFRC